MNKERMFKAEMLNAQLSEIEGVLRTLEEQRTAMHSVLEALSRWEDVPPGENMLVPLVPGIFVPALSVGDKQLLVNVGEGVVVPKTAQEVQATVEEQLTLLEQREKELQGEFNHKLEELSLLQEHFKRT